MLITLGGAATIRVTEAVWEVLPLVPVSVTVEVPRVVVPRVVTVSVEVPDPVTVAGEKLAVAPLGNPLALSVTTPAKPFNDPIVAVYVVVFPATTVCVLGLPAIVKSGGGGWLTTDKVTVVDCTWTPLVPVMVSVDEPSGVVLAVVTVSVEVPDPVTVAGEKLAVAPLGNPLALSVTTPAKPPTTATVVVYVVEPPTTADCEAGLAEMEKLGRSP